MQQYAVVRFLKEYINGENVVSEVPLTWLHDNNSVCKWPPRHDSYHIRKYTVPQPDWTDHPVECERICDSREEARKKSVRDPEAGSSTSSEIDMGRSLRKKRPNKLLVNYYACPSPPRLDDIDAGDEGNYL
uniref:Uncharacterized protein n=1 Tax=Photinus pyralis TaxID=7054 RepID=A0A1Y1L951_PHOPY